MKKIFKKLSTFLAISIVLIIILTILATAFKLGDPAIVTALSVMFSFTIAYLTFELWLVYDKQREIQQNQHKTDVLKLYYEILLKSREQEFKSLQKMEDVQASNTSISYSDKTLDRLARKEDLVSDLNKELLVIRKQVEEQYKAVYKEVEDNNKQDENIDYNNLSPDGSTYQYKIDTLTSEQCRAVLGTIFYNLYELEHAIKVYLLVLLADKGVELSDFENQYNEIKDKTLGQAYKEIKSEIRDKPELKNLVNKLDRIIGKDGYRNKMIHHLYSHNIENIILFIKGRGELNDKVKEEIEYHEQEVNKVKEAQVELTDRLINPITGDQSVEIFFKQKGLMIQ